MSFDVNYLGRASTSYNLQGNYVFSYSAINAGDTILDVLGLGYFDEQRAVLSRGTYIFVRATDGQAIIQVDNDTLPVKTKVAVETAESFQSGVEVLIGFDPLYGPKYELRNIVLAAPNNSTNGALIQTPSVIDFAKPVVMFASIQQQIAGGFTQEMPFHDVGSGNLAEVFISLSGPDLLLRVTTNFFPGPNTVVYTTLQYFKV